MTDPQLVPPESVTLAAALIASLTAAGCPPPRSSACPRGCPAGQCYCDEPRWAEMNDTCTGCGGTGECYCGEE